MRQSAMLGAIALAGFVSSFNSGSLAAEDVTIAGRFEGYCDYCRDFTDAAIGAGTVSTAYQVGVGYPDDPSSKAIAATCTSDARTSCERVADVSK